MKRVLIIGPMPEPTTGVSLANKVVAENLVKRKGFKVQAINTSYTKFEENLGAFSLSKVFFYLKINFFVYKIFKSDIVYITPGQTFFGVVKYTLFILMAKLLNKELVVHIHGNYVGTGYAQLTGFKKRIFKFLLKRTDKGIVLSESLTANMTPFIENKNIHVLYNFVEDYLFLDENIVKQKDDSKPKIIFLSNLMEEKGIFELLEALKILEENGFDYEAKIAGNIDDKHRERALGYFDQLKKTIYCGVVRGEEKKALLLWGNTFVLSTFYAMEGQPISILEAMATANLVLTTEHAGIPDIFKDGENGYFVRKKDPKDLAEKIKFIDQNKDKSAAIRLHNYINAKKLYRVDNFIGNIINIFEA